jgi:hypothetical protein
VKKKVKRKTREILFEIIMNWQGMEQPKTYVTACYDVMNAG